MTIYCFNDTGIKYQTSNESDFTRYATQARAEGLNIHYGSFFPYQLNPDGSVKKLVSGVYAGLSDDELISLGQLTLEHIRDLKISEIVAKHDTDIEAGCTFEGKIFRCDGDSRGMLAETISMNTYPVTWFTKTREVFILDSTKAQNLLNAMRDFVKPVKITRYAKEALVYSKTTAEEINSIEA